MPYVPGKLPYRGWITDCPYTNVPEGYSVDMLNVLPTDPFRRRVRLGTRSALNRVYEFDPETIQGMFRCISYNGSPPVRKDRIFIIAGGKAWYMDATDTAPIQITTVQNGWSGSDPTTTSPTTTAQLTTTERVAGAQLGQFLYLVDTAYTTATPPSGSSGWGSQAVAYWKIDLLSSPPRLLWWHNKQHSGDGPDATIHKLIGSNYYFASNICRYGARLVLTGVKGIENVWFMSKVGDPNDWLTGGTIDQGDAIAGTSAGTTIGPAGDEIIAPIHMGDQALLLAGKRSLTYLTNDPAVNLNDTRLAILSNTIGIVGPKAWCEGPEKTVYMLGQDGLYRLRPNDFSVERGNLVSLNKLDSFFNNLRYDLLDVALHYDVERRGVWIFLNRIDGPTSSTHLFYSEQTDGFFPMKLYDPIMPGMSYTCQAPTADGRNQIMLGAFDKMIGFFDQRLVSGADGFPGSGYSDPSAAGPSTDAGKIAQLIESRLSIGPMLADQPINVMIKEIQVELGSDEYLIPSSLEDGNGDSLADRPYVELHTAETAMQAIAQDFSNLLFEETDQIIDANSGSGTIDANSGSDWYDCQFARRAAGIYSSQDSFVAPTARKYYDPTNTYVLERVNFTIDRWVIRRVSDNYTLFAQMPARGATTSTEIEIGEYHIVPNGQAANITSDVIGTFSESNFEAADIDVLENLREGINNRMRVRKRSGSAYVRIESIGYPFAIERVAALVDPISPRRTVVEVT